MSRLANYLTGSGLLIAVLGLGLDVWLHARRDSALSAEELFALDNPGHVIFGAGLLLAVSGVVLSLWFHAGGLERGRVWRDRGFAGALVFATVAILAFGFTTSTAGHSHAVLGATDSAPNVDLDALDLSQEERFLVEESREEDAGSGHGSDLSLSSTELVKLGLEVERASLVAERYRSVDAALKDGYIQITQDLPLIGAHFIKPVFADGVFDIDHPEMLVYTFQDGAWRLYGLSYLSRLIGFESEPVPEGFTGASDSWHWHKDWCFTLTGARAVNPDECSRLKGSFVKRTGYMVHFWVVDNPNGVFAHSHPGLVGSDEYIVPFTRVIR